MNVENAMTHAPCPKNHIFMTAENDIQAISARLLNPVGISYFNYLRYYNDGSCYLLTTHSKLIEYVFEHNIPVAAPVAEKYVKNNFNYFILPIGPYDQFVHHAKIHLNLEYFIDLVDRYDDYIELFCFGSTPNNPDIVNFYLNNFDFLENFKSYFKDQTADLLKQGEKNKIVIPEIMKPPYQGSRSNLNNSTFNTRNLQNKKYFLGNKYTNIKLTPRQYDCLSQIAAGRTAKETALNLGLSHRTVENYLAHLKTTLDCHRKSQLIDIFLKNFK